MRYFYVTPLYGSLIEAKRSTRHGGGYGRGWFVMASSKEKAAQEAARQAGTGFTNERKFMVVDARTISIYQTEYIDPPVKKVEE